MAVPDDGPHRVEGFSSFVGVGAKRMNGRGEQQREQPGRDSPSNHLISALMDGGGSKSSGLTLSYSTDVSVMVCCTPITVWVMFVACIRLPNFLYPPSTAVIVIWPMGDSRVAMLPARSPVSTS